MIARSTNARRRSIRNGGDRRAQRAEVSTGSGMPVRRAYAARRRFYLNFVSDM